MAPSLDLSRFCGVPMLMAPDTIATLAASPDSFATQAVATGWNREPKKARDMYSLVNGVARVPVDGTLIHKLGGVQPRFGFTGYDCLDRIISDAISNRDIGAILLDIDSSGGEVAGCFELAKAIRKKSNGRGGKPIVAMVNEMACSAAYALAAACDAVMITDTGRTGSIGVWAMIVDQTRALDRGGVKVEIVRAGERKARGGPYETADAATVAKLQKWIDDTWTIFVDLVSRFRQLSAKAVRDLQGDWFTGSDALGHGLVDAIDSPDAIFRAVARLAR